MTAKGLCCMTYLRVPKYHLLKWLFQKKKILILHKCYKTMTLIHSVQVESIWRLIAFVHFLRNEHPFLPVFWTLQCKIAYFYPNICYCSKSILLPVWRGGVLKKTGATISWCFVTMQKVRVKKLFNWRFLD